MSTCSVQVSGTATGVTCVGGGTCPANCCTGGGYTGCSGSGGTGCNSYADCNSTCCTKTVTGCSGTVTKHCHTLYVSKGTCNADPCCMWEVGPPVNCGKKACSAVDLGSCVACGCTGSGTCPPKACTGISKANCVGCGCDKDYAACNAIACAALADNNPDVCEGCNTCGGNWTIDNARGNAPWSITVTGWIYVQGGSIRVASSRTLNSQSGITIRGGGVVRVGSTGTIKI